MNILNRVTMQSLKRNRTRTIITIIGIMLSTALICAVTSGAASMLVYARKSIKYQMGDWHATVWGSQNILEIAQSSSKIEEVSYNGRIQYVEYSDSDGKSYVHALIPASENYFEMNAHRLESGRYPQNSHELVVSSSRARLYKDFELGSQVELAYGSQDSVVKYGKLTDIQERRTLTVVGVLNEDNIDYAAMFSGVDPDETFEEYMICIRMKDPSDVYDFISDNQLDGDVNDELLMLYGASMNGGALAAILILVIVIIGLIAFGAYQLIHNAFSISISERTKQFGLLSSIGATKKQLRRMVIYEAFVISAVAIPLGLILGIAGMGVTFKVIGSSFADLMNTPFSITLCVSVKAIALAVVMTLAIILVSAWGPAERATKLNVIDSIRQSSDIKNSRSLRRTPRITAKLFGLPGIIATKHFKCNKSRRRATIASLFMSVVLFISAASFTMYLVEAAQYEYDGSGCDISFGCLKEDLGGKTPDEFLEIVRNTKEVTKAAYFLPYSDNITINDSYLTDSTAEMFPSMQEGTRSVPFTAVFINDSEFRSLLEKNGLSEEKFMDPDNPLAIASDRKRYYDRIEEKYLKLDILSGNEAAGTISYIEPPEGVEYWYEMYGFIRAFNGDIEDSDNYTDIPIEDVTKTVTLNIGEVIDSVPYYAVCEQALVLIYPYSAAEKLMPESKDYGRYLGFAVMSSDHKTSYNELKYLLKEMGANTSDIVDNAEEVEAAKSIVLIVKVFSYGFIVLISLISAANVFNTITTNVNLRRREFAMLRSVGMSGRSINKMMNYECLLYGLRALIFGLPVSLLVSYGIYRVECDAFAISFRLPWAAVGIAVFSVFAVVFAAMLCSMSRIKKDNTIDALKNDNV
ncbi:MAG: ABC transporter permease [Ruminococcus sp.]|nr:ABC transporter permease [Ruminococcus sp.]